VDRALAWVLLLYPRRMRRRYGAEIAELTEDLIRLERRSPVRLLCSLAVHGIGCRLAWFARTRVATAIAVSTSVACVALVNMGAASAKQPASHQTRSQLHSTVENRCGQARPRVTNAQGGTARQHREERGGREPDC
jgi:hypothetical protein